MTDTDTTNLPTDVEGGCHCGAVRYRVTLRTWQAIHCNCSICTQKGYLHHIVEKADFTLLKGEDALTTYRFNTGVAKHTFCSTCGIHPFYIPRSHPDGVDVNVRTLDMPWPDHFTITPFDGRNWEDNVETIR